MPTVAQIVKDIKALKIQGAREIAKAGLVALEIDAKKSGAKSRGSLLKELDRTAHQLKAARPTEPGLKRMVNTVLAKARSFQGSLEMLRTYVVETADQYLKELEINLDSMGKYGAALIKDRDVVMTHCHSHSVVEVFRQAKTQGKKFEVIVTESRPVRQGLLTARDLLKLKIPVIYAVDSAAGALMKKATKVMVGMDALLPDGSIVNKIGTFPIALIARQFGRPFYVVGGTIKYTERIELEDRDPKEVIDPKKLKGAKVENPAFDVTPSEFITSVVTEKGQTKPEMVRKFA